MSKALRKIQRTINPIGAKLIDKSGIDIAAKIEKDKAALKAAQAAAAAGAPSAGGIRRGIAIAERQGDIKAAAAAAGAVRSGNEADTLGKTVSRKKRSASAALLGE